MEYWVLKRMISYFNHRVQSAESKFQNYIYLIAMYLKIDKNPLNPLLQHSIIPIFQFNQLRWHSQTSLTWPKESGFSV